MQYGIGVPDDVSKAFHIMESLVLLVADGVSKGHGVLLNDIKDAYQTMDRSVVLESLYEYQQLRPVWGVANLALRHAGPRYVKNARWHGERYFPVNGICARCYDGFVSVFALSLHKIRGGVEGGSCAVGPWAGCGSVGWSGRVTLAVSRHGGVMAGASFAYFSVAAVVAIAVGNPRMGLASNVRDRDAGLASVTMITAI